METLAQAMQRVKATTTLKAFCEGNLRRAPRGNSPYVCPICGSGGSGTQNSDTAFTLTGERWHCHACSNGGDVFDLAGIVNHTEDTAERCNLVAAFAGVEGWDGGTVRDSKADSSPRGTEDGTNTQGSAESGREAPRSPETDHAEGRRREREYIRRAQANIEHPEAVAYLKGRGIDVETARAWGLGYDPDAGRAQREDGTYCRRGRIVIPWPSVGGEEPYYHADRSIAPDVATKKYLKPSTADVGPQPIWNPAALKAAAFFIVEGQMDALAVQACGYEAVALGSSGSRDLVAAMGKASHVGLALLMLDNDGTGRKAQAELAEELAGRGLAYLTVDVADLGTKDAGEAWAADPDNLKAWLGKWHAKGAREALAAEMEGLALYDPADIVGGIFTMEGVLAPIPTWIGRIDNAIGGGLPAQGLVTLGAVSSVGKTTLVIQICDNVAAAGRPVLFCSVEQSAQEIAAKSISRIMGGMARADGSSVRVTSQAILNRQERQRWEAEDPEKAAAFGRACEIYHERTHREDGTPTLYIMEPSKPPTTAEIRRAAEAIQRMHGQAPLVAVDYVQLLAAPAGLERGTDKQILDRNTLDLRQMARDMHTCVIAISSLNRAAYAGSIDLASFKESGQLEYSSDLLLGMQPYGLQEAMAGKSEDSGTAKAKAKKIMRDYKEAQQKQVELVILKNRNGGISKSPCLTFDGYICTFTESDAPTDWDGGDFLEM